jgi:hypothetical protein
MQKTIGVALIGAGLLGVSWVLSDPSVGDSWPVTPLEPAAPESSAATLAHRARPPLAASSEPITVVVTLPRPTLASKAPHQAAPEAADREPLARRLQRELRALF